MTQKILFTSFGTWRPEQTSNSSDDLFTEMIQKNLFDENCHFLRRVQVDFETSAEQIISMIDQLNPAITICCGMAEGRSRLSVESNGTFEERKLETTFDLAHLIEGTIATDISHDAGRFVCNHVYYSVLNHIQTANLNSRCLFVHVPLLNDGNLNAIVQDFATLVQRINDVF